MATLTIGSKEYTARCDFSFDRTANEKYTTKEEDKSGGTLNIYMGLLNEDALMLSAFWDCALAHLKSGKPTAEQIEDAIIKIIDEDTKGDATDRLINEAFQTLENAGFFKGKIRQQWTMMEKMGHRRKRHRTRHQKWRRNGSKSRNNRRNTWKCSSKPAKSGWDRLPPSN
ncbi:tail assembly chaperone [Bacillus safensis]|uniref:tail assembly chaperone n=1 Tax=Bacillus safensis TaxID=561879 RepID=UPI0035133E47